MPERIRYAVVGLGYIAQSAVLPAFAHVRRSCELVALVSDSPRKLAALGKRYGVNRRASYDDFDTLLAEGGIDAVYIALPNSLHREYAERAAAAGVHVLCEKPMAVTEDECKAMIEATEGAGVKLMIAYRLHFDQANLRAATIARSKKLGDVRLITSTFSMQVKPGDIRLKQELGGGPMYDIGIYCINGARMVYQAEPVEVMALSANIGEPRFREVDEMFGAVLRYPDERVAVFAVSFGATDISRYQIVGTRGQLTLDPAYEIRDRSVLQLKAGNRSQRRTYARRDQFAPELSYFADCIRRNRSPEPSGAEGLADVRIIEAIQLSATAGRSVALNIPGDQPPTLAQARQFPPVERQALVSATAPSGG
ncbi:MAG TPA: Gfo/Idh/MocA family oxidoreductase [Gemmatimonadales bacterium]